MGLSWRWNVLVYVKHLEYGSAHNCTLKYVSFYSDLSESIALFFGIVITEGYLLCKLRLCYLGNAIMPQLP